MEFLSLESAKEIIGARCYANGAVGVFMLKIPTGAASSNIDLDQWGSVAPCRLLSMSASLIDRVEVKRLMPVAAI